MRAIPCSMSAFSYLNYYSSVLYIWLMLIEIKEEENQENSKFRKVLDAILVF